MVLCLKAWESRTLPGLLNMKLLSLYNHYACNYFLYMNFFGFFEIVFAYSSTFFDEKFTDIVVMVFGYRMMNLLAQVILIISSFFYRRINQ